MAHINWDQRLLLVGRLLKDIERLGFWIPSCTQSLAEPRHPRCPFWPCQPASVCCSAELKSAEQCPVEPWWLRNKYEGLVSEKGCQLTIDEFLALKLTIQAWNLKQYVCRSRKIGLYNSCYLQHLAAYMNQCLGALSYMNTVNMNTV